MSQTPIKAFIIDDSVLIRYALTQLLNKEDGVMVVGDATANPNLLSDIKKSGANIILLDIPIPREVGLRTLKSLHSLHLPVIVFTKSNEEIARDLIPLLESGAVGFVLKPEKEEDVAQVREQILHELRMNVSQAHKKVPTVAEIQHGVSFLSPLKVVAIGSSTGGPEALADIMPMFPANFPYGIVIVQHMPADFTTRFAHRLNNLAHVSVKEAQEGDVVKAGQALLAPGDYHMVFRERTEGSRHFAEVHLNQDPPQWKLRPTVDNMMLSLAPIYGRNCYGVVLTGMGQDGVIGMREIKKFGGHTLVQNKATSVVFGMAQEVVKNRLADEVLPLRHIVPRLIEIMK